MTPHAAQEQRVVAWFAVVRQLVTGYANGVPARPFNAMDWMRLVKHHLIPEDNLAEEASWTRWQPASVRHTCARVGKPYSGGDGSEFIRPEFIRACLSACA